MYILCFSQSPMLNSPPRESFSPSGQGSVRMPGQGIRPVRAQQSAVVRPQAPPIRPQGQPQQKIQVIQSPQVRPPTGMVPTVRQPMIINTSSLMPAAQGSQKMVTSSTTNLARSVMTFFLKVGICCFNSAY